MALVAAYGALALVVPPGMFTDSAFGFLIADSMARGAAFNHLVVADLNDIALDLSANIATWSPGQYFFAAWLEKLGFGLGTALTAVTLAFTALGLAGWYRLYRRWAFSARVAAIAVAITAGNRYVSLPFGIYNGGEVLLFGTTPWFLLLLCHWVRDLTPVKAGGIVLAMAAMAFAKLSGLVIVYASLAALAVSDLLPPGPRRWHRPLAIAAIAAVFGGAFYIVWMAHGWTAAEGTGHSAWPSLVPRFIEGWAATVTGMFSFGDLAARLLEYPGSAVLENLDNLYLLAAAPALVLLAFARQRLLGSHPDYVRFATLVSVIYIALLALMYAKGGDFAMLDRFFRPLSLVLLVGVVEAVSGAAAYVRVPLSALATLAVVYGVGSYLAHLRQNFRMPLGAREFHHRTLSADGLALLRRELAGPLDNRDTVVWAMTPEMALEFKKARFVVSADFEGRLNTRKYHGHVPRLLVFVDQKMIDDGKAEIVLRAFVDYDRSKWVATRQGDTTVFAQ